MVPISVSPSLLILTAVAPVRLSGSDFWPSSLLMGLCTQVALIQAIRSFNDPAQELPRLCFVYNSKSQLLCLTCHNLLNPTVQACLLISSRKLCLQTPLAPLSFACVCICAFSLLQSPWSTTHHPPFVGSLWPSDADLCVPAHPH